MTEYNARRAARDKANRAKALEEEAKERERLTESFDSMKIDSADALSAQYSPGDTDGSEKIKRSRSGRKSKRQKKKDHLEEWSHYTRPWFYFDFFAICIYFMSHAESATGE